MCEELKNRIEMLCPQCKSDMKEYVLMYRCRNMKCGLKVKKFFIAMNTRHEPEVKLLPCGCTPDGNPIFWNPYNGVVQCHKCGAVYDYVNSKAQTASIRRELEERKEVGFDELFYQFRKCHHKAIEVNECQEAIMAHHLLEHCVVYLKNEPEVKE